jgi:DNA polymerase III delta prime subunit
VQAEVVTPPDKKSVAIHLVNILKKEQIEFNPVDVKFLVDSYYPDIRKIIGTAQQFSRNLEKKLIVDRGMVISGDIRTQLTDILKNGDKKTAFKNIRQLFADNRVTEKFDEFYRYLYDTVDDWSVGQSSEMIYILADMQYKSSIIPDKEINFMSCMFQILREIKK